MSDKKGNKGKLTVKVLRDKCIGAAPCVVIAPKVFQLDDEGIAVVQKQNAESDEKLMEAAEACPVQAIEVYDEDGKKIFP